MLEEIMFWIDQAAMVIMALIFAGMAGATLFVAMAMFGG